MVTMQVTDEDMADLSKADSAFPELHLGALTAVYQKQTLMSIKHMSGWVSF
jgi:hypothetical protein